ncbi:threonine/serine exporter family protein [Evansella sp. AB-rgal1]|uniref:threonine/serine exporter family protein n=1 Tax=Evansella sp. AB-rgal1 TaxID=3242696 RepID=UPI00359DC88C
MEIGAELIITFIAIVAFGVIFGVPKRALLLGGAIGMTTWAILQGGLTLGGSPVFSTAIASFNAAMFSHYFARKIRIPVTTLSIPGILPLVPGSRAYFTMLSFVEGDYLRGLEFGVETMLQAGSIAAGLVFALAIFSFGKGIGHRYEPNR